MSGEAKRWAWFVAMSLSCCSSADETDPPLVDAGSAEPRGCSPGEPALTCARHLDMAHRGGARLRPENTLLAFEHAAALGADVIELDTHSSADGVVVVIHDDTVDRTTDGAGAVHALSLNELQALDAGFHFTADGGASFPYRGTGVVIPTLEQVLTTLSDRLFLIEIKQLDPPIVDSVLAVLDATGTAEQVMLGSVYDDVVRDLRAKRPDVLTSMGAGEMAEFMGLYPESEPAYEPPAAALQAPEGLVDDALMSKADRLGVAVHGWTVNEPDRMAELLRLGIHGIITDDPATLEALLQSEGLGR